MKKAFKHTALSLIFFVIFQLFSGFVPLNEILIENVYGYEEDNESPTAPKDLKVIFLKDNSVTLLWESSSDNVGVTEYYIYNGEQQIGKTKNISFEASNLEFNTEYRFYVKARDEKGNLSEASNIMIVTTGDKNINSDKMVQNDFQENLENAYSESIKNIKNYTNEDLESIVLNSSQNGENINKIEEVINIIEAPTNIRTLNKTETTITLSWDMEGKGEFKYFIYNDSTKIGEVSSNKRYTIEGLKPNTEYIFRMSAEDSNGNCSELSEKVKISTLEDKEKPTPPTNLECESKNEVSANIIWDKGNDNIGIEAYEIYNGDLKIGETKEGESYLVKDLQPNTTYYFTIKSRDIGGNLSDNSEIISITTDKDMTPPSIPTSLEIEKKSDKEALIKWKKSSDISGVSYYEIYDVHNKIATVEEGTSYLFDNLQSGKVYNFTICAIDNYGNKSEESATLVYENTNKEKFEQNNTIDEEQLEENINNTTNEEKLEEVIETSSVKTLSNTEEFNSIVSLKNDNEENKIEIEDNKEIFNNENVDTNRDDEQEDKTVEIQDLENKEVEKSFNRNYNIATTSLEVTNEDYTLQGEPISNNGEWGLKPKGSFSQNSREYTLSAGGWDIGDNNDACMYAYTKLYNSQPILDCSIISNITKLINPNAGKAPKFEGQSTIAKAGVMLRNTNYTGDTMVFLGIGAKNNSNYIVFRYRDGKDTKAIDIDTKIELDKKDNDEVNVYLKLSRIGNSVEGYYSYDGITWTLVETIILTSLNENISMGLALTAGCNEMDAATGIFNNVRFEKSDTKAPDKPDKPEIIKNSNSVTLTWNKVNDNVEVKYYKVYKDGEEIGKVNSNIFTYTDNNVNYNEIHRYSITAIDRSGNESLKSDSVIVGNDNRKPPVPKNVLVASKNAVQITLKWDNQNDSILIDHYEVFLGKELKGVTKNNFITIDSLLSNTEYEFTVKSVNISGVYSDASEPIKIQTDGDDYGNEKNTATEIIINNLIGGSIEYDGDVDYFKFTTTKEGNYIIKSLKKDFVNYIICDEEGNVIINNSLNSINHEFFLEKNKNYYLKLYNYYGYGKYEFKISLVSNSNLETIILKETENEISEITISWNKANNEAGIDYYEIYRDSIKIATVDKECVTYTDKMLKQNTYYEYRVVAVDVEGKKSPPSNAVIILTKSDNTIPKTPTNLTGKAISSDKVHLVWSCPSINTRDVFYEVYQGQNKIGETYENYFDIVGLEQGTIYKFKVRAKNTINNVSVFTQEVSITTLKDDYTNNIKSAKKINAGENISGIFEYIDDIDFFKFIAPVDGMYFIDSTIRPSIYDKDGEKIAENKYVYLIGDKEYYIGIKDNSKDKKYNFTIKLSKGKNPIINSVLSEKSHSGSTVSLTWTKCENTIGIKEYKVYRNNILKATINGEILEFTDISLNGNTSYNYVVKAYDLLGNEYLSNSISVKTSVDTKVPSKPENLSATSNVTSISLTWTESTDENGIYGYEIYRDNCKIATVLINQYDDTKLMPGNSYKYKIRAIDKNMNYSAFTTEITKTTEKDTQAPNVPTGLIAEKITGDSITLKWNTTWDNGGIKKYHIFLNGNEILTTEATYCEVENLNNNTEYIFKITAEDISQNISPFSDELVVKTKEDDYGNSINNAKEIKVGEKVEVKFDYEGDYDFFKFKVQTDGEYKIEGNNTYNINFYNENGQIVNRETNGSYYLYSDKQYYLSSIYYSRNFKIKPNFEDNIPPTIPKNLKVESKGVSYIELSWEASKDNVGVEYYEVYRNDILIAEVIEGRYVDTNLYANSEYIYTIKSIDTSKNKSELSSEINIKTEIDFECPSIPKDLSIKDKFGWSLILEWSKSEDNGEIDYYEIYLNDRYLDCTNNVNEITGKVEFKIEELTTNTKYLFKIRAKDKGGNYSEFSDNIEVSTINDDYPDTFETASEIRVGKAISGKINYVGDIDYFKFTAPISGIYHVEYLENNSFPLYIYDGLENKLIYSELNNSNNISLNLIKGRVYYIELKYYNYDFKITVDEKEKPFKKAEIIEEETKAQISKVTIKWNKAEDNIGIDYYNIYRNNKKIATVQDDTLTFTDKRLKAYTEYTYEVEAVDVSGNVLMSEPITVRTLWDNESPKAPKNLSTSSKTAWEIRLNWDESEDDGEAEEYEIFKDGNSIGKTNNLYFDIIGLNKNTSYNFYVIAMDTSGKYSERSSILRVDTYDDDYENTIEAATKIRIGKEFSGIINYPNDKDTFRFIAPIDGYYTFNSTGNLSLNMILYDEENAPYDNTYLGNKYNSNSSILYLNKGKEYVLELKSYLYSNRNSYSFKIDVAETEKPNFVENSLRAVAKTTSTVTLSWSKANDNVGIDYYEIFRDGELIAKVDDSQLTYTDKKLYSNKSYNYKIRAVDVSGNESDFSNIIKITTNKDTTIPNKPSNVQVKGRTSSTITLIWDEAQDDDGVVVKYRVYNGKNLVAETTNTECTIDNLEYNSKYVFTIKAIDSGDNISDGIESYKITTYGDDHGNNKNSATSVELNKIIYGEINYYDDKDYFSFEAINDGTIIIKSSEEKNISFTVYDSLSNEAIGNFPNVSLGEILVKRGHKYFIEINLSKINKYSFKVLYKNDEILNVKNTLKLDKNLETEIIISWNLPKEIIFIDKYKVYRNDKLIATVDSEIQEYIDKNFDCGSEYKYYIVAVDGSGLDSKIHSNELKFTSMYDMVAPNKVENIYVTNKDNHSISLSWKKPYDNKGVVGYNIYVNGILSEHCTTEKITLTGLAPSTKYGIQIVASDKSKNTSEKSDTIYVITPFILEKDELFEGDLNISLGQEVRLNGHELRVTGSIYQDGGSLLLGNGRLIVAGDFNIINSSIDFAESYITVEGSLYQTSSSVNVNRATVVIKKDFLISEKNGTSSAVLYMNQADGYIQVGGNFKTNSRRNHLGLLTNGILEVKGDFTRLWGAQCNFAASNEHIVILNGDSIQKVTYNKLGTANYCKMNILILTKPYETGYIFNDTLQFWQYIIDNYSVNTNFGDCGGDGVYGPTGNYGKQFIDLEVNNNGMDITFVRTYNSLDTRENTGFGKGWSFNYEASIQEYGKEQKTIVVRLTDGSCQSFKENVDGSYKALDSRNILNKVNGVYVLTTKTQYKYEFDKNGYLVKVTDKNGNSIVITVDKNGKVQSIKDAVNRVYKIEYNSEGLISSIIDAVGNKTSYVYNNKMLIKSINAIGSNTSYSYNSEGLLSTIKNNENTIIQGITYYGEDKKTSSVSNKNKVNTITDEYGNVKTYSYSVPKMTTTITDSNGRKTIQKFSDSYNIISNIDEEGKTTITDYNSFGEEIKIKDRNGNTTEYTRDNRGNITKILNPDGSVKRYVYDEKNNLIKEADEENKCTYYIYDTNKVLLMKKVQPLNGIDEYSEDLAQNKFVITRYEYYSSGEGGCTLKGLLKFIIDGNGHKTSYTYDSYGNITETKINVNGKDNIQQNKYNKNGLLIEEISPEGNSKKYIYNRNGDVVKTIYNNSIVYRVVYDLLGRMIKEISPNHYKASDDKLVLDSYGYANTDSYIGNYGKRYTYYANGCIKTITDEEGYITSYTYDKYGNVLTETKPNGAVYRYEYDKINRKISTYFKKNSNSSEILLEKQKYEVLVDGTVQKTQKQYLDDSKSKYAETITIYDYANRVKNVKNAEGLSVSTEYNKNGTVKSNKDLNGNITYYKYDGLNRVIEQWIPAEKDNDKIKYSYNKIEYDAVGNKIKEYTGIDKVDYGMKSKSYIIKTYEYYEDNKLKSESYENGSLKRYEYDKDGNVVKEIVKVDNETNNIKEYVYDEFGQVIKEILTVKAENLKGYELGNTNNITLSTEYTYDKNGNITKITEPDKSYTKYEYDNLNRVTKAVKVKGNVSIESNKTYDWEGNILTSIDGNGNKTSYQYNERGFLIKVIDALKNTTMFFYDTAGRKIAEVSPNNYVSTDIMTHMQRTEYIYDNMGRVIEVYQVYKNNGTWRHVLEKKCIYDNIGNLISEKDALGNEISYTYTLDSKLESVQDADAKAKNKAYTKKYYYDGAGRLIKEKDTNETEFIYEYDELGNLLKTSVKDKNSNEVKKLSSSKYNLVGEEISKTDANNVETKYEYNEFGKVKKVTYASDGSIAAYYVIYQYDTLGQLAKTISSSGVVNVYGYDILGNVISQTESDLSGGSSITKAATYDANGNKTSETDGNGTKTTYTYNKINKLVSSIVYVTDSSGKKVKHETKYDYDKNGNLISETDWLGNRISYVYDSLNRVIEKKDQYNKTIEKLEYNDNGTQSKSTDALGNSIIYKYDGNKRKIEKTDSVGTVVKTSYDYLGNVSSLTDGNGNVTEYTYDYLNRLINVKKINNGIEENTEYTYDLNGNMLTQTTGKVVVSYEYNVGNKVSKKISSIETEIYKYNGDGTVETKTDKNGVSTNYIYDIHGRVTEEKVGSITIKYTYDKNNNILTLTDSTGTTTRTYDELNSVTSKTVPKIGKIIYKYDVTEGITNLPEGAYAEVTVGKYNSSNRLTGINKTINGVLSNTTAYTYDKNGNTLSKTITSNSTGAKETNSYDILNQLTKVTTSKGTISYADNGEGYRIYKKF